MAENANSQGGGSTPGDRSPSPVHSPPKLVSPNFPSAQVISEERLKVEPEGGVSSDSSYLASLIRLEIRALEKRLESAASRQMESLLKQFKSSRPSSRLPATNAFSSEYSMSPSSRSRQQDVAAKAKSYHSHQSSGKETEGSIDLEGSLPLGQRSPCGPLTPMRPFGPVTKRVVRSESRMSKLSEASGKLKHFMNRQFSTLSAKDDRLRSEIAATMTEKSVRSYMASTSTVQDGESCCCLVSVCRHLLKRIEFEAFFAIIIIANIVIIGLEVDTLARLPVDRDTPLGFGLVNTCFTLAFLFELAVRLIGAGCWDYFLGPNCYWNSVDLLLVLTSLVELAMYLLETFSDTLKTTQMRAFRILRIARTLRGIRVLRLLRIISSLRMLIFSIMSTMRSLGWTIILLSLILYSFSIIFTQSVVDHCKQDQVDSGHIDMPPECEDESLALYWSSIPRSMYTLFMAITNGLSWHQAVTPLFSVSWFCVLVFITYIVFTFFAVMNVVTGVFCQSAIEGANADKDVSVMLQLANKQNYVNAIKTIFQVLDHDDSLEITMDEFQESLNDPRMQAYMESLEIHALDAWTLFKIIDTDNSGAINVEEFVNGCLQLRGSAKAVQLAKMSQENKISRKYLQAIGNVLEQIQMNMKVHNDVLNELKAKSQTMERTLKARHSQEPLRSLLFERLYQQPDAAGERGIDEEKLAFSSKPSSECALSDSERVLV